MLYFLITTPHNTSPRILFFEFSNIFLYFLKTEKAISERSGEGGCVKKKEEKNMCRRLGHWHGRNIAAAKTPTLMVFLCRWLDRACANGRFLYRRWPSVQVDVFSLTHVPMAPTKTVGTGPSRWHLDGLPVVIRMSSYFLTYAACFLQQFDGDGARTQQVQVNCIFIFRAVPTCYARRCLCLWSK
jgi:hypothetical protein